MGNSHNARTDWIEIQSYYDEGHSESEVCKQFVTSPSTLWRAAKRGDFKYRTKREASILGHKRFPQKHTDATKQKLSQIRKQYLTDNPDKVPYLLNHYSKGDSYPERYFESLFTQEEIHLVKKKQIWLYQLDFCDPEKKIDIEIDGDQHYLDQKIVESDKRRTAWLTEKGWKVIRIRWSDYKKMSLDNRREFIKLLKEQINAPFSIAATDPAFKLM